jgi:diaphanous 3
MAPGRMVPKGPKMKAFHWEKMAAGVDMSKTVWATLEVDHEELGLDMKNFEERFSAAKPKVEKPKEDLKPKVIKFADPRRTQVIDIGLARFSMTPSEIRDAILNMDERLDTFKLKRLTVFVPDAKELKMTQEFKGNVEMLGTTEKFFLEMSKVPHCAARLSALCFTHTFADQVEEIMVRIQLVERAHDAIRDSENLQKILTVVLAFGNRMNQATAKGQARGFRLASLDKLRQTKSADNKTSLLHFLVQHVHSKMPETLGFLDDLALAAEGARVEESFLSSELAQIKIGLEEMETCVATVGDQDTPEDPRASAFYRKCDGFFRESQTRYTALRERFTVLVNNCNEQALYFGEPSMNWEELFAVFNNFSRVWKTAEKDLQEQVDKKNRAEKQAALKITMDALKAKKNIKEKGSKKKGEGIEEGEVLADQSDLIPTPPD